MAAQSWRACSATRAPAGRDKARAREGWDGLLPVSVVDPRRSLLGRTGHSDLACSARRELAALAARLRGLLRWRLFGRLVMAGLGLGSLGRGRAAIWRRLARLAGLLLLHRLVERLLDRLPAALGVRLVRRLGADRRRRLDRILVDNGLVG